MTLAVGVELIKMLSQHTPATVVEVLMFAIAREMVTHHDSAINTAIGVMSICVLLLQESFSSVRMIMMRKMNIKDIRFNILLSK